MQSKVIAMYLPQFHEIPENSEFWGKGFTDWIGVKNAKPIIEGQIQPTVPLNNNYYDLSSTDVLRWQANLAKKYGVYGFGFYHYWFSSDKNLLQTPSENYLKNKDINLNFCFAWDNSSWVRTWSGIRGNDWAPTQDIAEKNEKTEKQQVLVEYKIGDIKDWRKHFDYLLPFFRDERYIKINNKPVFIIFNYDQDIDKMCENWNNWAREYGFSGIEFIFRLNLVHKVNTKYPVFNYEPSSAFDINLIHYGYLKIKKDLGLYKTPAIYDYEVIWKRIIKKAKRNKSNRIYHGALVKFDDTPRRGNKARIIRGASPDKFKYYMTKLLRISSSQNKRFVFLTAWNEWGEGAYLEPDTNDGYTYLEALKEAVKDSLTK